MNTKEFLTKILPSEGVYASLVLNSGGGITRYYETIDALAQSVIMSDHNKEDTFYCISSLAAEKRLKTNVRAIKTIAMDIDCGEGKPYPSWKEAAGKLADFISTNALPAPMVVSSGRGLHVYWVLDRELAPAEWTPLAASLRDKARDSDFHIDAALMSNSVLLLRPIGTHNHKREEPEEVNLLIDSDPVSVELLMGKLAVSHHQMVEHPKSALAEAMEVKRDDYVPASPTAIVEKCAQINWGTTCQDKVDEPFWYALLGVAAFCDNAEQTALEWSENYPEYNEARTRNKLKQWQDNATGPTTCDRFRTLRPRGCHGCALRNKITSPAQIGVKHAEIQPTSALGAPTLPKPYKLTKFGIKREIEDTDIDVCDFNIYPVSYGYDEKLGYETVHYRWNRPHEGWTDLIFRQAYLASGVDQFAGIIADQGIVLKNFETTKEFQHMVRTYMQALKDQVGLTNLFATMGWKNDHTKFILGTTLMSKQSDGTIHEKEVTLSSLVQKQGASMFSPCGDLAAWVNMTTILDQANLLPHMFALGVGFSAPLYSFTGLKGITISYCGPTGGGKSLAQQWCQSIYGNPDKLHFTAKYTINSLFNRIGFYSNLPFTVDEVTMMGDNEVSEFCYWVTQGQDKIRLNEKQEERPSNSWSTPVLVSTNMSLQSKLIASKLDTDAQMARLLELTVAPQQIFLDSTEVGKMLHNGIHRCYGTAGRAFIKGLLAMGKPAIKEAIENAGDTFSSRYGATFSGSERYWEQAIILADTASSLAHNWGLIKFDYKQGIRWVLNELDAIRHAVKESHLDAYDTVTAYLNEFASNIIAVRHTGNDAPYYNPHRLPKGSVHVRLDFYRKNQNTEYDRGTMLIDRVHFRRWLAERGEDISRLNKIYDEDGADATPKSKKGSMGKGTEVDIPQMYVLGFNLAHPRFKSMLTVATNPNDATMGELAVVGEQLKD